MQMMPPQTPRYAIQNKILETEPQLKIYFIAPSLLLHCPQDLLLNPRYQRTPP